MAYLENDFIRQLFIHGHAYLQNDFIRPIIYTWPWLT